MAKFNGIVKVEPFSLPTGAVIDGYRVDPIDGMRYPFGQCDYGVWAADQFGCASWATESDRMRAWDISDKGVNNEQA